MCLPILFNRMVKRLSCIPVFMIACAIVVFLSACGDKIALPDNIVDSPDGNLTDTVYVAVRPIWTEADGLAFKRPHGISIGYDRTIYISDTENDRIVRLSLEGSFIESYDLPNPVAAAQDRSFNLTSVGRSNIVWFRDYHDGGSFYPKFAIDSVYMCETNPDGSQNCFWDRANLFDVTASPGTEGRFYLIDEAHNEVLSFSRDVSQLLPAVPFGSLPGQVSVPLSVATSFDPFVEDGHRLYVAQFQSYLGVQVLDGRTRLPVLAGDTADLFTMTESGYKLVTADALGNIYVLHQPSSEVIKFSRHGQYILRFGRQGSDVFSLNKPLDIAVLDETLYIADTDNNRIVRYRMATVPEN